MQEFASTDEIEDIDEKDMLLATGVCVCVCVCVCLCVVICMYARVYKY
jgi:hypothetical protein